MASLGAEEEGAGREEGFRTVEVGGALGAVEEPICASGVPVVREA